MKNVEIEDEVTINFDGNNALSVLGIQKGRKRLHDFSIKHEPEDLTIYNEIYKKSDILQNITEEGLNILPTYDKLNKDIFLALNQYAPVVNSENSMKESSIINNRIVKQIVKEDSFKDLRNVCNMDPFNSALATKLISDNVNDVVKQWAKQVQAYMDANNIRGDAFSSLETLIFQEETLEQLQQQQETLMENNDGSMETLNQIDDLQNQIDTLQNQIKQNPMIGMNSSNGQQGQTIGNAIQSINIDSVKDMVTQIDKELEEWGIGGSNTKSKIPYADKKTAVERLLNSNKLKQVSKLLGRLKTSALTEQKKKSEDKCSIKSVEVGNDFVSLLPNEKLKLVNKSTKKLFYRQYANKELLQYQKEGNKRKCQGPIIVCVDTSGSMEGTKEYWSKAVTLSFLTIAQMQNRDFACILFSHIAQEPIILDSKKVEPKKILDIAETFDDGGTDFKEPLEKAMNLIKDRKIGKFKKADIIFITDGECKINDDFLRKLKALQTEKEFKILSILINAGRVSDTTLKKFSDDIIPLSDLKDLNNNDKISQIFQSV